MSEGATDETTVSITDNDDPAGDGQLRGQYVHGGGGGHGHGDGDAERGPGADGGHSLTKTNQGGATSADYSGVPASVTFNAGETSQDLRLRSDPGHGGRRRREREAGLRDEPAGRGERGLSQRDHGEHHGRRRPAGDGPASGQRRTRAIEGGTATVTVELSADPERTVEVRITATNQGGATWPPTTRGCRRA